MDKKSTQIKGCLDPKLSIWKAKDCLVLAEEYFYIASQLTNKTRLKRGAIDTAYNAAELCAKGMLYLKLQWIPSTHKGVVQKFSQLYVKDGPLTRELGRDFHKSLFLRNQARYEKTADVTDKDVGYVIQLTKDMISLLQNKIQEASL